MRYLFIVTEYLLYHLSGFIVDNDTFAGCSNKVLGPPKVQAAHFLEGNDIGPQIWMSSLELFVLRGIKFVGLYKIFCLVRVVPQGPMERKSVSNVGSTLARKLTLSILTVLKAHHLQVGA